MNRAAALGLTLMLACGPAGAGLFTDDEAHRKIDALQQQLNQMQQHNAALEGRLGQAETLLKGQGLVELLTQVEQLKAEVTRLRGQLEVNNHSIETTQKRQKDLYVDLDTRLRQLERGPAPGGGAAPAPAAEPGKTSAAPAPAPGATPAGATAAADPAAETRAYESALGQFKIGNYPAAIAGFESFIRSYPQSQLASGAQYWIGNAHFNLREYKNAIAAQQKLLATYPSSAKAPDAMLNIATAQQDMGEPAAAKKTLNELVSKYPVSEAAEKAKARLAKMK